jgi:hypothetical protein
MGNSWRSARWHGAPELDELIERAISVRRLLEICSECDCDSIDVCLMLETT